MQCNFFLQITADLTPLKMCEDMCISQRLLFSKPDLHVSIPVNAKKHHISFL